MLTSSCIELSASEATIPSHSLLAISMEAICAMTLAPDRMTTMLGETRLESRSCLICSRVSTGTMSQK
jgi:hypothetical protein